jgi:hypothetical protein
MNGPQAGFERRVQGALDCHPTAKGVTCDVRSRDANGVEHLLDIVHKIVDEHGAGRGW